MKFLRVQRDFAAALRGADPAALALADLSGNPMRNQIFIEVYRGNVLANAGKALALAYPVVMQIVGDEFFEALGRAYWQDHPPVSGNLNTYGEGFAGFLAQFQHVQDMPYLPDVARIEWLVHLAYGAADHVAAGMEVLSLIDPDRMADTCFVPQAAMGVLASDWPVVDIWQQHQPDYDAPVEIDLDRGQQALVFRQGLRPQVALLSHAEAGFWRALHGGLPLGQALERALDADASFDAGTVLQTGFTRELILGLASANPATPSALA